MEDLGIYYLLYSRNAYKESANLELITLERVKGTLLEPITNLVSLLTQHDCGLFVLYDVAWFIGVVRQTVKSHI